MFEDILQRIKPSKEEEKILFEKINEFVRTLEQEGLEVLIGGSIGKSTWLKGTSDVDLYVLFEEESNMYLLKEVLDRLNIEYITVHGSRDYYKVFKDGLEYELVPILKIDDPTQAKNVTDISPFHIKYVKKKISENPLIADEIRLTKAFMKGIGCYGAESYIQGFSGYACEVLTIYYNGFVPLLKAASQWRLKVTIDPEKYYSNEKEILTKLNKDKLKSPIIVIDPVHPERNITSSVSTKSFATFIFYSRRCLRDSNPEKYFEKKKPSIDTAINRAKKYNIQLFYVKLKGRSNNLDVANTKVLKFVKTFCNFAERIGFLIFDSEINFQNSIEDPAEVFIFYYPKILPNIEKRIGPPAWVVPHSERFFESWKNSEFKIDNNGRLLAFGKREIREMLQAFKYFLNKYKDFVKKTVEIIEYKDCI